MTIIPFPEQTTVYAENQPQYLKLPAHKFDGDPQGRIACCWRLSFKERLMVLFTGLIWQQVLTFNAPLQPQLLTVYKPDMHPGEQGKEQG